MSSEQTTTTLTNTNLPEGIYAPRHLKLGEQLYWSGNPRLGWLTASAYDNRFGHLISASDYQRLIQQQEETAILMVTELPTERIAYLLCQLVGNARFHLSNRSQPRIQGRYTYSDIGSDYIASDLQLGWPSRIGNIPLSRRVQSVLPRDVTFRFYDEDGRPIYRRQRLAALLHGKTENILKTIAIRTIFATQGAEHGKRNILAANLPAVKELEAIFDWEGENKVIISVVDGEDEFGLTRDEEGNIVGVGSPKSIAS